MKKKTLITGAVALVALALALDAKAQNDTTIVKSWNSLKWETETYTSDKGNTRTNECCTLDGKTYPTTKTARQRAETAKRFGVKPNLAIVTTPKTKKQRVIVL